LPKEERNFNDVWSTHATSDGVYFMTINAIYHYQNGKVETIPIKMNNFSNVVYGYLIIPMMTEEPLVFLKGKEIVRLPFPRKYYDLIRENVSILPHRQGKLLIMTHGNGIFVYDFDYAMKNLEELKALPAEEIPDALVERFSTEINDYILQHGIYRSCQVHENSYALATRSGGIVVFDQEGKLIQVINKERGLKQNMVWDIYADKDKNLWAALNSGISYIELSSPISCFSEINGLEETANAMCRYEDTVYIAAMSGVNYLQKYQLKTDRDNNVFVRINQNYFETWGFAVQKGLLFAAAGPNGVLWVKDKKLIDLGFNRKELRSYVYSLGTSRKFPSHVFVGLWDSLGIFEIKDDAELTAQSFHYSQTGNLKDIKTQVRYFADDKYGNLWVASAYQGIMCLKFTGDKPDQFETHLFYGTNGVPKELWQRMWLEDDRILLGNSQGFMEAALPKNQDYRNIQFTANEALNSLLPKNANVGIIYLDEAKNIWFLGSGRFTMLKKEQLLSLYSKPLPKNAVFRSRWFYGGAFGNSLAVYRLRCLPL
jgi:ligand-binding sensor domain-containing protein